jgi:hypothetical protein
MSGSVRKLEYQSRILYMQPISAGDVEFQKTNLGLPVREVTQGEFLERLFGDFKGHICIFQKQSNGISRNTFFKKKEADRLVSYLNKTFGIDTYISYSTYYNKAKKNKNDVLRTQSNIVKTYMIVQDLDYYKGDNPISDADVLRKLGEMIRNGDLICPSFIISTGRGYQLIWLVEPFSNISGYANDRDWHTIQEHLYQKLREFNSDNVVKNPSAVTRLVGTKHRISGNKVYGYLSNEAVNNLQDFMFFHDLVPTPDRKVVPKKRPQTNKPITRLVSNWNEFTLNRSRENDIFIFVQVQNERGKSYIGIRNWLALVLRFHAIVSSAGDYDYAQKRVIELCSTMDMSDTSVDEILRRSKTAEKYYEDWKNGTWDKDKYFRGGLFYTNARMLELMDIIDDYYIQWKMNTIKFKNKEYEAARKRFEKSKSEEEANERTWNAYQVRRNTKIAEDKEDKLWSLKETMRSHPEWTNEQLAKHFKVTPKTIQRWKKQL